MRNWGLAFSSLDLATGVLDVPVLSVIKTGDEPKGKQVRVNSYDIERANTLYSNILPLVLSSKVIFVEAPVGSQNAAGMKAYGICVGLLGALRAQNIPLIEVTASEVKRAMTNSKTATKDQMISAAVAEYPTANWPRHGGVISASSAEHMADAIGAIHAGVNTQQFQNLMRLLNTV